MVAVYFPFTGHGSAAGQFAPVADHRWRYVRARYSRGIRHRWRSRRRLRGGVFLPKQQPKEYGRDSYLCAGDFHFLKRVLMSGEGWLGMLYSSLPIRVSRAFITAWLLLTTRSMRASSRLVWQSSRRSSSRFIRKAKKTVNPSVTSIAAPCFCRKFSNQVSAIVFMSVTPGGGTNGVSSTALSALWGEVNK